MLQGADAQTRSSMTAKLAENVRQQKEKLALQQDDAWSFWVDPYFLRDLYNVGSASGSSKNNSMAVAQFLEQYFSTLDLNEFFVLFYREAIGNQPTVIGPNPSGAGTEASLDIEYIMALGANVPTTFWSNAGREANQEPFLKWMTDVGKTEHPPLLFSVSYGDDEDSLSFSYTERVNTEFQKQGARGISILFASGDDGVGGDGRGCTKFVPSS
jgi:tripeptidyl-peptidase-1